MYFYFNFEIIDFFFFFFFIKKQPFNLVISGEEVEKARVLDQEILNPNKIREYAYDYIEKKK